MSFCPPPCIVFNPYGFEKISALGVEEQRVNVVIDLISPLDEWRALGHGFAVEAQIAIWSSDDVLTVPVGALYRDGGEWAVFVAEGDRAYVRAVEIGHTNAVVAELISGLEAGSRVVLYPSDRIADGVGIEER